MILVTDAADKCSLKVTPKRKLVAGNCISEKEHVFTYCSGTCGVSKTEPRLLMSVNDDLSIIATCECCAGKDFMYPCLLYLSPKAEK